MAAGKKNAKVKWAIGGAEPDDLPDFESNDDIIKRNKGALPPKGRTRVLVKKLTVKPNRNGDDRINVTCEINEPKGKKRGPYDGYTMWEGFNVTEQGAPYLKRFLTAIGVTWGDFIKNTVIDETADPKVINKIGSVKFDKPVACFVSIKHGVDQQDEERAEVGRFLPPADDDEPEDEDVEDSEEDEEDDDIELEEDDDSEDEAEDEEDEEDEDDEDEEEALREELTALKLAGLKKRALRSGADEDDLPGKKAALIDLIVELELGEEDEEDEEDEDEDEAEDDEVSEDDLRAELKSLALGELRDRARANGRKHTDLKGAKKPALIDMIVEDEIPPF